MKNNQRNEAAATRAPELPGDFGRRLRHWRQRAGISREDVAERAGMSPGYLEYLETRPSFPSSSAVTSIAASLNTSVAELLGGNVDQVPGRESATRQPRLVALDPARSWELLGSKGVGRIVFDSEDGPVALPVNYVVARNDIVLRTNEGTAIARIEPEASVSFEVDHIDDAMSSGWSVLIHATCQHLDPSGNVSETAGVDVDPWAGGPREHWIQLRTRSITGRAIETDVS